jgi:hypothetical protein
MSKLRLLIFISLAFASQAQHLTISNTGETGTSGTNWSIVGNVLQVSGSNVSANVHPSVIVNHLTNTGDLAINIPNINGVFRNIIVNNAIAYTGNTNRTLVIKAQNHITMNTGSNITSTNAALNVILRSANATGIYVEGYLHMTGVTINTNGGHLWIAGGGVDTQWNGLTVGDHAARIYADAIAALKIYGCTLNTNGGQLYVFAHTFESGSAAGDNNYGLDIDNTTISTGAGNIDLKGELFGRYTTGFGTFIGCRNGNIQISTTSGYINISGLGYDQNAATNGNGTRHATNIAVNSGRSLNISTVSGNITISGSANFNNSNVNDAEGLLISSGNTAKSVNITSQTGNITLTGSNTRATTGQFCNGIRLYALDVANAIYIGDDGVNPYTGNITLQADAILQRVNNAGAGSIAIKTSGSLTIQPVGNNFTYLRAGNSPGTLSFDDDWNFGSSNSTINFGKTGNSFAMTVANPISTNGTLNFYASNFSLNSSITTSGLNVISGTNLTVQANKECTINGTLTNNGSLTLENGATLVQGASSTLAGSGVYNVKQTITGAGTSTPTGRFWYLGSPVATASSAVFFASNSANVVKKRNEATNAWTVVPSGTPENLTVGRGYYTQAMANSTITFTGGAVNNGDITISGLSRTASQGFEGFNLVSNPYPSYLNWDNVVKTEVSNTMWYRTFNSTNNTMVFDTYVAGTNGIGTNLNGAGVSNLIPPMQSFWVRVNPNANPSLNNTGSLGLTNAMRAHFTSINGSVAGLKSTSNERDLFLRMNLLQADKKDQLIVYVNETATNGFDLLDGEKMMQAGFPQFYTKAGDKKIVINGLNSAKKQQSLPITMELPTTGVHSFIIEDLEISNGLVWLEDKQEEIIQALEPGTVYEFYAASGLNAERFVLHFQLIDDAVPTNVYNEVNNSANFSGKGANVHAEAAGVVVIKLPASTEGVTDIQIRDAAGRIVYTGSTNTLETSVQLSQANGIYYVTLNSNAGVEVRKVFIQQ